MTRFFLTLSCFFIAINLTAQDYFPISVGNKWILEELNSDGDIIESDTTIIKDNYVVNNLDVFLMEETFTDISGTNKHSTELITDTINKNDIYFKNGDSYHKIWQHQYTDGDKWAFMDDTIKVVYVGPVNVPAGNFDDCFYVKSDSVSGWIFAPDVGIVKTISENETKFILTSYELINDASLLTNVVNNKIRIFPNPSTDYISISNLNNAVQIDIYDIMGKVYYKTNLISNPLETIDISALINGIYFVRILTSDNKYISMRFLKR